MIFIGFYSWTNSLKALSLEGIFPDWRDRLLFSPYYSEMSFWCVEAHPSGVYGMSKSRPGAELELWHIPSHSCLLWELRQFPSLFQVMAQGWCKSASLNFFKALVPVLHACPCESFYQHQMIWEQVSPTNCISWAQTCNKGTVGGW